MAFIGVIGAGLMGAGIATKFIQHGHQTIVQDISQERINELFPIVQSILAEMTQAGRLTVEVHDEILARLDATTTIADLRDCDFVIEAAPENLALKQSIFRALEDLLKPTAILASNTSGLLPDRICEAMQDKSRFLVAHFWNPPHLMPLVEVVPASTTRKEVVDAVVEILFKIDATPVVLKKAIPGFIGNRLQFAVLREALHIVESGVAEAQVVDAVMKASLGRRYSMIGPFEGADMGGLDTFLSIAKHLIPELATGNEGLNLLQRLVDRGEFGIRTGQGFYEWSEKKQNAIQDGRIDLLKRNTAAVGD